MQKGFSLPLVLVFLIVFLSIPVFYFVYMRKDSLNIDVKGVRTESSFEKGLSVRVISKAGTWDLKEYLCKTKEECLSSLESGKQWGTVSGGLTEGHEVKIESDSSWQEYGYMKMFMKPSWGSIQRSFIGDVIIGSDKVSLDKILDSQKEYDVVIIPISELISKTKILIEFTD